MFSKKHDVDILVETHCTTQKETPAVAVIVDRILVTSFPDVAVIYKFTRYIRTISHMNYVLQVCSVVNENLDGSVVSENLDGPVVHESLDGALFSKVAQELKLFLVLTH